MEESERRFMDLMLESVVGIMDYAKGDRVIR